MKSPIARICVLAPTERGASLSVEALPPPFVVHWACAADQISQSDDMILVVGWKQDSAAACMAARSHTSAPIVLLAHENSSRAVIEGLRAGADLVIPTATPPAELQARVRALLRRQRTACGVDPFHVLRLSDSTP